ncbi:ras-related and estrogen-regulated growth inhibitor-like [Branchiostoma lanceolatum]|uniref:ras-related and estrogen-regulated growth inhibitor-like n=1 Tax=Branchiostoma lanceolatum TaxID=7740 RepID=UPI003452A165
MVLSDILNVAKELSEKHRLKMTSPFIKPNPKILKKRDSWTQGGNRPIRIVVLGQAAVGKTALVVRYITRRFIGDYDPTLETIYKYSTYVDGDELQFEILDTAGQDDKAMTLEDKIRWGDCFIIVYSITDKCSFDEITRIKFLINHVHGLQNDKVKVGSSNDRKFEPPVMLVGNKKDLLLDRMVKPQEGENMAKMLGCMFFEVSTRESYAEVKTALDSLARECKKRFRSSASPGNLRRRISSGRLFSSDKKKSSDRRFSVDVMTETPRTTRRAAIYSE